MQELVSRLKTSGVQFLRIGWIDSGGVLRAEAQTLRHLASVLEDGVPMAALGDPLLNSYTAVKRAEIAALEGVDFAEEISQLAEVY